MTKIAILGFGTVGSGVAEVLAANQEAIDRRVKDEVRLKYILDVRPCTEERWAPYFIKDFSQIEKDPEVSIVVETIGGVKAALDFTRRALEAGKSVVTSNKELVAEHGCELLKLAREKGVCYLFEASVGGGIPIIRPLYQCLGANEIEKITGILNGTTNYILTRMIRAGLSFEDALKEAQEKGYAEQDPTADVEGHDACRKICILADIAFGQNVPPARVPTRGIRGVTAEDVSCAAAMGCKVKLFGRAIRTETGSICAFVEPHFVPEENPLAGVEDVFNAIMVSGNAVGDAMFYGRGAGKLPTASAVVADVMDAARGADLPRPLGWEAGDGDDVIGPEKLKSDWCVRLRADAPDIGEMVEWPEAPAGQKAAVLRQQTREEVETVLKDGTLLSAYRVLN